jgi:predicted ATP-dependent endonuclease of OLD family
MFCEEVDHGQRRLRKIYWAGFGFQIWIQFLTHLLLAKENALLVVDEPDIYLHPELQRKLYELLVNKGSQFVLATHSSEIINEADPDEIVVVDRRKRFAKRVRDVEGLQAVLDRIGSKQNIYLTKLSAARKVLFVEGHDFGLIRRFARRIALKHLSEGEKLTAAPLGGFSKASRIDDVAWGFEKVLKADIRIAVP